MERHSPNMAEILPTHTPALFAAAVRRSVALLRAGELVALPTETVYGLAANALDAVAVAKIFAVKGRPAHNPIIVHVASLEMARQCVGEWPAVANRLAASFWPGPLTLVLPRSKLIPNIVTAGGLTVGVRWPSHPFIQAVIREGGFPLAAPSANPSSQVSATTAAHVRKTLGHKIPLVVDGGATPVGIESTVLDVSEPVARLLRPGMIHFESLMAVIGPVQDGTRQAGEPLKSPGLLKKHYSPKARLVILRWEDTAALQAQLASLNLTVSGVCLHILAHTKIPSGLKLGHVHQMPHDPAAFARGIYAELHACDEAGAQVIVVEAPPSVGTWRAIIDRLQRAAASEPQ